MNIQQNKANSERTTSNHIEITTVEVNWENIGLESKQEVKENIKYLNKKWKG